MEKLYEEEELSEGGNRYTTNKSGGGYRYTTNKSEGGYPWEVIQRIKGHRSSTNKSEGVYTTTKSGSYGRNIYGTIVK